MASPTSGAAGTETQSLHKDRCLSFIHKLWEGDTLAMFHHPVSAAEVLGYYEVIQRPMDLSTIRKKLKEGAYKQDSDVEDDVALMLSNALQFNEKSSPHYHLALQLRKKYVSLAKQSGLSFDADGAFIPGKKALDDESTLRKAEKKIEEKLGEIVEDLERDQEIPIEQLRDLYKRRRLELEDTDTDSSGSGAASSQDSSGEDEGSTDSNDDSEDSFDASDDEEDDESSALPSEDSS